MSNGVWLKPIRWMLAVGASAYAGHLAIQYATPIDLALPFIAALVAVVALASYPSLLLGVPLLVLAENVLFDERLRLMAFGVVMAATFAIATRSADVGRSRRSNAGEDARVPADGDVGAPLAIAAVRRSRRSNAGEDARVPADGDVGVPLVIAAILLLRWIPFSEVRVLRELLLIAFAVAIVEALGRTSFAIVVAVVAALVTPAVPLRTFALPFAVLVVALVARFFGAPRLRLVWPSAIVLAFVTLFFPWSGIMARAFPYFVRPVVLEGPRLVLNYALAPRASKRIEVPQDAKALIVSGANVARLRRGALLGRIEPGGIVVRIGDVSDWGYMRREHFYGSRNPLPRDAAGRVRGWGYVAWIDGAGRVPLPPHARTITITADASLPPDANLQVEAFELR